MRALVVLVAVAIGSLCSARGAHAQDRPRPIVEAVVGYLRQGTIVGSGPGSPALQPFTSGEGTFSGGIGARIALGDRFFVAPEFRIGWEPEMRIVATTGFRRGADAGGPER